MKPSIPKPVLGAVFRVGLHTIRKKVALNSNDGTGWLMLHSRNCVRHECRMQTLLQRQTFGIILTSMVSGRG